MTRAVIIGGGIGGLATGIALRRAGLDVAVFERAAALREVGAGIALWTNALKALRHLGLSEVVRTIGIPEFPAALRATDGRSIAETPVDALRRMFGELCLVMHRADLLAALGDALGTQRIHLGEDCVGFSQRGDAVEARFASGHVARGDILVGGDGINSIVRAALHGHSPPSYAGYTSWRAVIGFDRDRLRAGETWGRGARFGQIPMSGGRAYWFATANAPAGERSAEGEKKRLRELFGGWHEPIGALIDATDESAILRNDIQDRPVLRRWGVGRVTLVGDAAHPMTPNLGQGGCQALEDAVVLGDCFKRQSNAVAALRAYEARRIRRANRLVVQSRRAGRVGQWSNPLAVRLRDALIGLVSGRMQARAMRDALTAPFDDLREGTPS